MQELAFIATGSSACTSIDPVKRSWGLGITVALAVFVLALRTSSL